MPSKSTLRQRLLRVDQINQSSISNTTTTSLQVLQILQFIKTFLISSFHLVPHNCFVKEIDFNDYYHVSYFEATEIGLLKANCLAKGPGPGLLFPP